MPTIKIITQSYHDNLPVNWNESTKFNSKGRIVDAKGRAIDTAYQGERYKIIKKMERSFSTPERIGRGLLGVIAVICSLCLALISKSVRHLFTKHKETIRLAALEPKPSNSTIGTTAQQNFDLAKKISSDHNKKNLLIMQQQQEEQIKKQLESKLALEQKRNEQLAWYQETEENEEKKFKENLAKIEKLPFPDNEIGKKTRANRIESLKQSFEEGKEARKQRLDGYLNSLEEAQQQANALANILS